MKQQIAIALGALALSLSASANPLIDALQGDWRQIDRICTDGSEPQDLYEEGRDEAKLSFDGTRLVSSGKIDGESYRMVGAAMVSARVLIISNSDGVSDQILYYVSDDELTFFSAGFGEGGSCPVGEGVLAVYKRLN